ERLRVGVEPQLLEEAEGLRWRQRLEQLRRLIATPCLDQEQRRAEPVAPLHPPVHLQRPPPVHPGRVTRALVRLARSAQLPGTLPGEPGLIELLRTLVELRYLVEAAGLHVQLHQELPPLPFLEERLRLTGRKLRGQPARGVAVLR